ncbi:MAG TPA: DUF6111 family protein [Stellaceae bacterium]|nr:DUF6111 family protein [Stellaceae bacterium]
MLRVFLTIVLPLVLPTALYLLWMGIVQRPGESRGALPWPWLAGAGALLLVLALLLVIDRSGSSRSGVYVPPRAENGRIVPGHFEPRHSP